ncbi:MAG: HAMP domain-containing histidine kinase [Vicinamibacteria bacterium]|nr:HAMP domain-containing histidine kinase [Vicinamibacteria bacterium]
MPLSPPDTGFVGPHDDRAEISLDWVIRLRWWAVAGQTATVLMAQAVFGGLRLAALFALIGALAATNLALALWRRRLRAPRLACGAVLAFDTLLLTGLLQVAGGAYNPFSVLYLVHITLAAVVLGSRWTWFLAGLAVACFGMLFLLPTPHLHHAAPDMSLHLRGMWIAFAVAAALTAYFVVHLTTALERRDEALAAMRERVSRHQRVAAVTTLATGAAHELGTPLATIAVASKELERAVRELPEPHASRLAEDAGLIRAELERCRGILDRLATDAGQAAGEDPGLLGPEELAAAIRAAAAARERDCLHVTARPGPALSLARGALLQVVQNLARNALEAGATAVRIEVDSAEGRMRLRVADDGAGMEHHVLERAGEPFFSTKAPGSGLGLGLFVARSLVEQMGGRLRIDSTPGRGTEVCVEVPDARRESGTASA